MVGRAYPTSTGRVSADLRRNRPDRWHIDPALPAAGGVDRSAGEGVLEVQQWGVPVTSAHEHLEASGDGQNSADLDSTTSSGQTTVEEIEEAGEGSMHIDVDGEERARARDSERRRARARELSPSNLSPLHTPAPSPEGSERGSRPTTTASVQLDDERVDDALVLGHGHDNLV
jgi:hypothetical protein